MGVSTELSAIDHIFPFNRGFKPKRNAHAWNSVLRHSQGIDFEGMNHIQGTNVRDHRLIHRNGHFVQGWSDVVFAGGIIRNKSEGVGRASVFYILFSKNSVGSRDSANSRQTAGR